MSKYPWLTASILTAVLAFSAAPVSHSSPQTIGVIQLTFYLSTSSDWTRLTFYNLTLLTWEYRLISGQNAPQLSYSLTQNIMAISKRQYDETNVTLEIEGLVQPMGGGIKLLIEKGAIGDTILIISHKGKELALISSVGSVPGHEDTNARSYELTGAFSKLNQMELTLKKFLERQMVLAFYYPWYGNALGRSGLQYHWSDVTFQGIGSSTYYPLFGPYDSQDESLIGAHIELAKASGIDGFICSWWGIDTFEDRSFKEILKVAESEGFKVTIYYESVRDMGRDQIVDELAYVVRSYSNEPSFLKIDGRPVIFLYAVSAYDRDARFWQDVVKGVKGSTNSNPLYIADTFDMTYAAAFDGFHTYNPIWMKEGEFNSTYVGQAKAARVACKIWAATVCPGYDDRKIRSPGTYVSGRDGAYYNLTWKSAICSDPDIVLICTWNEWHEGTNIEPSREFGFKFLQLTNHWSSIYKDSPLGELPDVDPSLNQSLSTSDGTLMLEVRNLGKAEALALNILLCYQNVSDSKLSGIINLPVNDSCICLFVPLLRANETLLANMSYRGDGMVSFTSHISYYSTNGKEFVTKDVTTSSTGEGGLTMRDLLPLFVPILVALVVATYLTIRLILRLSHEEVPNPT